MRKVSFALAVGLVLVACGGGEENPAPKTPATPVATTPPAPAAAEAPKEEPKKETLADLQQKTMKGFLEAMNAHDAKKLSGFYADSAVLKMGGQDSTGRDAIAQAYGKVFDGFKDYACGVDKVWVKGDVAVGHWVWTGTHTGDFMGAKATEKKAGVEGVDVAWFTPDGQIKEHHIYTDFGTVMSQLGLSKQKARPLATLPSGAPQIMASTGSADEAKNADVVKAMNAALEGRKEADFLATMSDTIEWDDMTMPQGMKGKADAKKFFKEMTTAFPDLKVASTNAWPVGDFVIVENTWGGTQKAAFFGIPATKKTVNAHNLDVVQVKDGKVVKGWAFANSAELMQQLGLAPKAAEPKAADKKPAAADKKPAAVDKKPAKK